MPPPLQQAPATAGMRGESGGQSAEGWEAGKQEARGAVGSGYDRSLFNRLEYFL